MTLFLGFIIDLIFGDPHGLPHPVQFIGALISLLEKLFRKLFPKTPKGEFIAGMIVSLLVVLASFAVPMAILALAWQINHLLAFAIEAFFCYEILATKALKQESMKVYHKLVTGTLEQARKSLSYIVGRDTEGLDQEQITKATVETVAENTSDGIIAPMIFIALGGAPLGFCYKAINTLDSMIGYKNDKYLYFGKFAAKLDDVANYIPARISAWLMLLAGVFLGEDVRAGVKIYKRDNRNHASPNSAHTEAVCAGLMGVSLGGGSSYHGKMVEKPTIGDATRPIIPDDIMRVNRLLYATATIGVLIFSCIKIIIMGVFLC